MYHHRITYTPEPAESKTKQVLTAVACFAVFAFIGVLLAWRG